MNPTHLSLLSSVSVLAASAPAFSQHVELLSEAANGASGALQLNEQVISGDGRWLVFSSLATDLGTSVLAGTRNVYLRDLASGSIQCLSQGVHGTRANGDSDQPTISEDGRLIAFRSVASNLSFQDTNGAADVFLFDRQAGTRSLVNNSDSVPVALGGDSGQPSLSANGTWLAFTSSADLDVLATQGHPQAYRKNLDTGILELVSQKDGAAASAAILDPCVTNDGQVAFASRCNNLGDDDGADALDVFRFNGTIGDVDLMSYHSDYPDEVGDSYQPVFNRRGNRLAFTSTCDWNRPAGNIERIWQWVFGMGGPPVSLLSRLDANGDYTRAAYPRLSPDGNHLIYASPSPVRAEDTDMTWDIYRTGLPSAAIHTRMTTTPAGGQMVRNVFAGSVSNHGLVVVFPTTLDMGPNAANGGLLDVYARFDRYAVAESYGTGWAGTLGVPGLEIVERPVLGITATLRLENSSGALSMGVLVRGAGRADIVTPYGGSLLVQGPMRQLVVLEPGWNEVPLTLPTEFGMGGVRWNLQTFQRDLGASGGAAWSQGLELRFGN